MQPRLFLVILMGPCSVLTRDLYKYHFINESKTWDKAQEYCKLHHTYLAVLSGDGDVRRLLDFPNFQGEAWIGLRSEGSDYTHWKWSDGCSFTFRNWDSPQTSESQLDHRCALIVSTNEGKWKKNKCDEEKHFFCYHDYVVLIQNGTTWEDALNHCRDNYHDLVTITNPDEQRWVQERAGNASTTHVWMGLKYSCFLDLWFWVSDMAVIYDQWGHRGNGECDTAGAMDKGENKWYSQSESELFHFICVE